jgi:hypothetical protein
MLSQFAVYCVIIKLKYNLFIGVSLIRLVMDCNKPRCNIRTSIWISAYVTATILVIIYNIIMLFVYRSYDIAPCSDAYIPPEFVQTNCNLTGFNVQSYNLSVSNVCNETNHLIEITSIPSTCLQFDCFYDTIYCNITSLNNSQITTVYFDAINNSNNCFALNNATQSRIRGLWISLETPIILLLPFIMAVIIAAVIDMIVYCRTKRVKIVETPI